MSAANHDTATCSTCHQCKAGPPLRARELTPPACFGHPPAHALTGCCLLRDSSNGGTSVCRDRACTDAWQSHVGLCTGKPSRRVPGHTRQGRTSLCCCQASRCQVPSLEGALGSTTPRLLTSPQGPSPSSAPPDTPPSPTSAHTALPSRHLHCRAAVGLQAECHGTRLALSRASCALGFCGRGTTRRAVHRIIGLRLQPSLHRAEPCSSCVSGGTSRATTPAQGAVHGRELLGGRYR